MDFINKVAGGDKKEGNNEGGGGGFLDKANEFAGGGKQGEKNEDGLDKAIDLVQEHGLGEGKQNDESAGEQAKDNLIASTIRDKYEGATGSEFPIEDKDKKFGF